MKICIYFMHAQTLGETQRVRSLAACLARDHEVLVINAGIEIDVGAVKCITLPHGFYDKTNHRTQSFRGLTREQVRERAVAVLTTLKTFDPNIFITKSFPFQFTELKFELLPALKWAKQQHKTLISSLGYPLGTVNPAKIREILALYDKILVHCPKELDPTYIREYWGNESTNEYLLSSEKALFTGYILPEESRITVTEEDGVLISRGSGVVNDEMMQPSAQAALELGMRCEAVNGMIGGKQEINKLRSKGITVHEHLDQRAYTQALARAKYSISMCGYGTAVQLLWTKKQGILFPKLIDQEQWYRAHMLEELLGSIVLKKAKKEDIKKALRSLKPKEIVINTAWFDGLDATLEVINGLANNRTEN